MIGADGAISAVGRQEVPGADKTKFVFAYHEIIETPPATQAGSNPDRCEIYYRGSLSPDFYAWIFPHGDTMSVGTGSAHKGFSLKGSVGDLRNLTGLAASRTLRKEGAPIPLKPLKRWDNGRDVVLAGDAAGVVAPASGEGIYYAMLGGRLAAEAAEECLATGDTRALAKARSRFMKLHGRVFWILGLLQYFWYSQRQAARALRQHLPRSRRSASDVGILHEQGIAASRPDGACPDLFQGSRPPLQSRIAMTLMFVEQAVAILRKAWRAAIEGVAP